MPRILLHGHSSKTKLSLDLRSHRQALFPSLRIMICISKIWVDFWVEYFRFCHYVLKLSCSLRVMQVWFLKQSSLPCVDLNEGHAMLMETPWKVAMAPAGNGALFSDLRAAGFIEKLSSQGVKYVQVFCFRVCF